MPHAVAERAVDEAPARRGAVQPADLERRLVEVLDLKDLAGLPVPRHDLVTHLVHRRVTGFDGMGMRPARRDDQVQLRLDPDVVHVVGRGMRFEEVAVVVELHQRARRAAFFRAEHRDHHATRHSIEGVGSREAGARGEVGDRLDELRVLGIGGDVVDEQSVREQPTGENPIGVGGVAEVMRFVPGRPGRRRRDHLSIARRRGVGVEHRQEVGVFLIGVAGPDVQQGLVLAGGEAPDEYRLVRGHPAGQHESLLYVWTSDADQKDPDFLSVLDADPASSSYGKVIATAPTGSPGNEAHHFGYTANADRTFAVGLFSNRLFIYDVATDPKHPNLVKTVPDLAASTGYSGPHTFYAVPGGVMVAMLGTKEGGAPGALVKLDNDGNFLEAHPAPDYMYDVGVKPELNLIVTSSWAHPHAVKAGNTPMDQVG